MKIVDDAVKEIIPHLKNEDDFKYRTRERKSGDINFRLDWEWFADEISDENFAELIQEVLTQDINYIVEESDVNHPDDYLARYMDGSKKRGTEPISVEIPSVLLCKSYHKTKCTMEYTLYILLAVEWPA